MIADPILNTKQEERTPAESELRKQKLARLVTMRGKMGYEIESQTETSAVLVTNGRRRMFGLRGGEEHRTEITLNDEGTVVSSSL
jgi:hypothetical protein